MSSNRSFGILFFIVFLGIGLWPLKNNNDPNYIFLGLSSIFLILGIINSKLLYPLNKAWVKFGEILGMIIAPIVMGLVYFIILTPISFFLNLLKQAQNPYPLRIIFLIVWCQHILYVQYQITILQWMKLEE